MNPEMHNPETTVENRPEESTCGVKLDPDSIRALLEKIRAQEQQR